MAGIAPQDRRTDRQSRALRGRGRGGGEEDAVQDFGRHLYAGEGGRGRELISCVFVRGLGGEVAD